MPFVDVLNTMLDDTLPLTPPEWPEWGNPIESKDFYQLMASYSPYDNVEAKAYPAILALSGRSRGGRAAARDRLNDERADFRPSRDRRAGR